MGQWLDTICVDRGVGRGRRGVCVLGQGVDMRECVSVFGTGCGYGRGRMGDVLLCLGQRVDMGEGGWEMCDSVWDRVWIWEKEEGRCIAVFGTGCGYGRRRKGYVC
jgi:hypothetical protein